jgi:hypothetical protein
LNARCDQGFARIDEDVGRIWTSQEAEECRWIELEQD